MLFEYPEPSDYWEDDLIYLQGDGYSPCTGNGDGDGWGFLYGWGDGDGNGYGINDLSTLNAVYLMLLRRGVYYAF